MVGSQTDTLTRSLHDLRHDLLAFVRAGIGAADAGRLLEQALQRGRREGGRESAHEDTRPQSRLVAAGKAAPAMARTAARLLGDQVRGGLVVSASAAAIPGPFEHIVGGHPLPTAGSERAGRRALEIADSLAPDETLLVLLSGGASALMAAPADGVTLDDKRRTTERLLREGADIHALNAVRKHLSAIKGGWLAARARGACRTLSVSDVVGDDPSVIASGPTLADASTFSDALDVLRRFGGTDTYPARAVARLEAGARGALAETPKPGDARLARATSTIIGGRGDAMDGAAREAERRGYEVVRVEDAVVGDARTTAPSHLRAMVARAASARRPACIISAGETTVKVVGRGRGGRNQEFALALVEPLASLGVAAAAASAGTDGIDGPTDAAGAIADSATLDRARRAGLGAPARYLDDNDAYAFFDALGDLIHTGPTDTNVGDLQIILLA